MIWNEEQQQWEQHCSLAKCQELARELGITFRVLVADEIGYGFDPAEQNALTFVEGDCVVTPYETAADYWYATARFVTEALVWQYYTSRPEQPYYLWQKTYPTKEAFAAFFKQVKELRPGFTLEDAIWCSLHPDIFRKQAITGDTNLAVIVAVQSAWKEQVTPFTSNEKKGE